MHLHPSCSALRGLLVALGLVLGGCAAATPPAAQQAAAQENFNDPFENTNRAIFGFNQSVNHTVLIPVAKTYRTVLPMPVRQSIHDFLQNLNGPIIFANDALQGQVGLAATTLGRFVINMTVGVAGMFDVATRVGLPYHTDDLGITLAVWGVPSGPYLVLPILGSSNPRDVVGMIGDGFGDPGDIIATNYNKFFATIARQATSGVDELSRNVQGLSDLERTSLDFYATLRSVYRQRRAAEIRHEQNNLPNAAPLQGADAGPASGSTLVAGAPAAGTPLQGADAAPASGGTLVAGAPAAGTPLQPPAIMYSIAEVPNPPKAPPP